MFWVDFLFVFIFALILSGLLSWGFGWRHPARGDALGASFLFLFLILLFAMWGAGAWYRPLGPAAGPDWLGLLLIGLFVSLLVLAVAAPTRRPRTQTEAAGRMRRDVLFAATFGVFFWILIVGLLVSALISYSV